MTEINMNPVIDALVTFLLLPLQLILIPIDAFLAKIPGLAAIPSAISNIGQYIGHFPSTIVNLIGVNPLLWNTVFLTFLLYITVVPAINLLKKIWAWFRP